MHTQVRALAALGFVLALLSGCNCGPNKCGPGNCPGCCDSSGVCQGGFLPERCGTAGEACAACSVGQTCSAGHCALGSTGGGGGGSVGGGGGGTGGGGGGSGGGNPNTFCPSYAAAYCDYGIRCGQFASEGRSDCVAFIEAALCAPELSGVSKGYDTFNGATAQACVSSFATLACGTNDPTGSGPCAEALVSPASSTGQGCFSSNDCVQPTDACSGNGCNRTCSAAGGLGQSCPRNANCDNGLRCDTATNTCANPHALGETCVVYGANECGSDAYCDETTTVCTALPVSGPCHNYGCASSAYCDSNMVCQTKKGDGQACNFGECIDADWCDYTANYTCAARKGAGSSCLLGEDSCQSALTCRNSTCQPQATLGQSCDSYSDCVPELSCDTILKICVAYSSQPAGQPCTEYESCAYPNVCRGDAVNPDGGVGTTGLCGLPMVGDPCNSSYGQCPAQSYCNQDGGTGTCTASTHSSRCSQDADCLSGDFCGSGGFCQPQLSAGGACDPLGTGECVPPLQCVTNASDGGTCGMLGGPNAACAGDNSCLFPYTCVNGSCTAAGHQGQPCFGGFICLQGLCQPDAGVLGTCTGQLAPDGTPCLFSTECQSGVCSNSACTSSCP